MCPAFNKTCLVGTNLGTRAPNSLSEPIKLFEPGWISIFGALRNSGATNLSNGLTVVFVLPLVILAFCLPGFLVSPALTSSPRDICSAGVRSTVAPSCGVAVPEPGADGGGEGPGSVGGVIGFPLVFIDFTCARTRGPAGSGAVNIGTRDDTSGARTDRVDMTSAGADLIVASGAAALASGAAAVALASVGLSLALLASPVNAVCIGRCSPVALISVFLVNLPFPFFPLGTAVPICSSGAIASTGRCVLGSFNALP